MTDLGMMRGGDWEENQCSMWTFGYHTKLEFQLEFGAISHWNDFSVEIQWIPIGIWDNFQTKFLLVNETFGYCWMNG
jgi:hypothetical protein